MDTLSKSGKISLSFPGPHTLKGPRWFKKQGRMQDQHSIGMCCVESPWNGNTNVGRNLKVLWMEKNHPHLQSSSPNTQHISFMLQPLVHPWSLAAWTPSLLHLAFLPSSMFSDWLPMSLFQMSAAFRHFCSRLSQQYLRFGGAEKRECRLFASVSAVCWRDALHLLITYQPALVHLFQWRFLS